MSKITMNEITVILSHYEAGIVAMAIEEWAEENADNLNADNLNADNLNADNSNPYFSDFDTTPSQLKEIATKIRKFL